MMAEYVIPYASEADLRAKEKKNYIATKRECLVVVGAFQMLLPYIERRHFTFYTDHQRLKRLLDLLDIFSTPRLTRWRLRLQEFDILTVRHRRGPDKQSGRFYLEIVDRRLRLA